MADAGAIRSARAAVEIFVDGTMLARGLQAASSKLRNWAASVGRMGLYMASVGGALTGTAIKLARSWETAGASLLDMSQRTGLSVEMLSELQYAAKQTGTQIDNIESAIERMNRRLDEASQGNAVVLTTLGRLGLTLDDLKDLSVDKKFETIARALANVTDATTRSALAARIFGNAAGNMLLPMLARGGAAFDQLRERARNLGLVLGREEAEAAHGLDDAFTDLTLTVKRLLGAIGQALAPLLSEMSLRLADVAVWTRRVVREHGDAIVTAFKWAVGLFAAGKALLLFGAALQAVGSIVGIVASVIGAIGMLPPLIVAAGAGLLSLTDTGKKVSNSIKNSFGKVKSTVIDTWHALVTALKVGDVEAAVNLIKAVCNLAWVEITSKLKMRWEQAWNYALMVVTETVSAAQAVIDTVKFGLSTAGTQIEGLIGPEVVAAGESIAEEWRHGFVSAVKSVKLGLSFLPWTPWKPSEVIKEMKQEENAYHSNRTGIKDREAQGRYGAGAQTTTDVINRILDTYNKRMAKRGEKALEAEKTADKLNDDAVKQAQKDVEKARKAYDAALQQANEAPKRAEEEKKKKKKEEEQQQSRAKPAVAEAASITASVGAFSGAVVSMLARAWPGQAKLLSAAEQTAKNTREIADRLDNLEGLEFD